MSYEPTSAYTQLPSGKWGAHSTQGAPTLKQSLVLWGVSLGYPIFATIVPQVWLLGE